MIKKIDYPSPLVETLQPEETLTQVTIYQDELEKNDKRRKIRVIRPERIKDFVSKYRTLLNDDQGNYTE
jgi:hypothetical protein